MSKVLELCKQIGEPIINELGYTMVDVEYVKEGKYYILRYMIESGQGIDLDDCAVISERISHQLDQQDPIPQEYMLEITSPGAERPLKTKEDIIKSIGKYVHLKTYAPIDGSKEFEGDLVAFEDDVLTLAYKVKTAVKTVQINYDQIAKIRLAIKF